MYCVDGSGWLSSGRWMGKGLDRHRLLVKESSSRPLFLLVYQTAETDTGRPS